MARVPMVIAGLGTFALLSGGMPAHAQTGTQRSEPATFAKADPRTSAGGGTIAKGAPPSTPAARPSAPNPAAAAVTAVSSAPAHERAAAPASLPSRLSADAPSSGPSVGVVGGGPARSGPSPAATPEPSTLLLMGAGIAGLYGLRRRR